MGYKKGYLYKITWIDADDVRHERSYQMQRSVKVWVDKLTNGYLVNKGTDCEYWMLPARSISLETSNPITWNEESKRELIIRESNCGSTE